jgi:hypothetical protein
MGSKHERWAKIDLSGYPGSGRGAYIELEIRGKKGDIHTLPVSHLVMQYAVNQIPQAAVFVPLGRSERYQKPSAAYAAVSELFSMTVAVLRLHGNLGDFSPEGDAAGDRTQFPPGPAVLFTGYVRGIVYRRVHGQIGLVVNLSSRLLALTLTAAGSSELIPGSPDDFVIPTLNSLDGKAYAGAAGAHLGRLLAGIPQDFPKTVIECLKSIAENSFIQTHEGDCRGIWGASRSAKLSNAAILSVLNADKDSGWRGIRNLNGDTSQYPLLLDTATPAIAPVISARLASSLAATHFWGAVTYAAVSDFGMAILPTASDAYLAPILRNANLPAFTIYPDEYADLVMTAGSMTPLYGVAVVQTGAQMGTQRGTEADSRWCVSGTYIAKTDNELEYPDGPWMFVQAPDWFSQWSNAFTGATPSEHMSDLANKPSKSAIDTPKVVRNAEDRNPKGAADALQAYAKMRYTENVLRGREGTIVGKLRFDIAPGTLLQVSGQTPDKLRGGRSSAEDKLATDMFGFVSQVTIAINAQQSSATTSFRLTEVRTAEENTRASVTMADHPFFGNNYFRHRPLVPELTVGSK